MTATSRRVPNGDDAAAFRLHKLWRSRRRPEEEQEEEVFVA